MSFKASNKSRAKKATKSTAFGHKNCGCCRAWADRAISEIEALGRAHEHGDREVVLSELERIRDRLTEVRAEVSSDVVSPGEKK